jgi:hypothetical protein
VAGGGGGERESRGFPEKMNFLFFVLKYFKQQGGFHKIIERVYCSWRASMDRGLIPANKEAFFCKFPRACLPAYGWPDRDRMAANRGDVAALRGRDFVQE